MTFIFKELFCNSSSLTDSKNSWQLIINISSYSDKSFETQKGEKLQKIIVKDSWARQHSVVDLRPVLFWCNKLFRKVWEFWLFQHCFVLFVSWLLVYCFMLDFASGNKFLIRSWPGMQVKILTGKYGTKRER